MEFNRTDIDVVQFNKLCMQITQAALDVTGRDTVSDEELAVLRQLRSTAAVLMSALQQVASIQTAGFSPIPP